MAALQFDIEELDLQGKVVLITGGSTGIGKATVELFHSKGAKVVFGNKSKANGEKLQSELGSGVIFEPCDVTSWSSQYRLFERAISEFGRLDIVVANAGVVETVNFFAEEIDPESGKLREPNYTVLDINLKGLLATTKLALHFLKEQKSGVVVMVTSTAGYVGDTNIPVYSASKHGIVGLMRSLTRKSPFTDNGIRINCVAPFMTESAMLSDAMRPMLEKAGVPINRASTCANAIAYCAVQGGYTGKTIYVADNKMTEIEGPIAELRPQWLGEFNAKLVSAPLDPDLLISGHQDKAS